MSLLLGSACELLGLKSILTVLTLKLFRKKEEAREDNGNTAKCENLGNQDERSMKIFCAIIAT